MANKIPIINAVLHSDNDVPEEMIRQAIGKMEGKGVNLIHALNSSITKNRSSLPVDLKVTEYILKVNYSLQADTNEEMHSASLILKKEQSPPTGNKSKGLLTKELSIYNTLLQEFHNQSPQSQKLKLQNKRQLFLSKEILPLMNSWNSAILLAQGNDSQFLFLKNIEANYIPIADESKELDFNHSLVALDALARFHANSYFLKKQMAKSQGKTSISSIQLLNKFPFAEESFFTSNNSRLLSKVYEENFELVCKVVENYNPSLGMKLRRRIQGGGIFDKLKTLLENEKYENSDLHVFCHGNFSVRGLLFKYESSGEPLDCKIVNYEFLRYAPLASDLAYFFSCCTDEHLKNEFQEKLIAHYCDSFENEMVEKLGFPQAEFDIEEFHRKVEEAFYGRMMEFGFLSSCLVLPLMAANNSLSISVTEGNISQIIAQIKENLLGNAKIQARILDNVKQVVKKGLL